MHLFAYSSRSCPFEIFEHSLLHLSVCLFIHSSSIRLSMDVVFVRSNMHSNIRPLSVCTYVRSPFQTFKLVRLSGHSLTFHTFSRSSRPFTCSSQIIRLSFHSFLHSLLNPFIHSLVHQPIRPSIPLVLPYVHRAPSYHTPHLYVHYVQSSHPFTSSSQVICLSFHPFTQVHPFIRPTRPLSICFPRHHSLRSPCPIISISISISIPQLHQITSHHAHKQHTTTSK